jgi:hypothetical protein
MASIPASQIVAVTPAVISAGGSALVLNGLMLTQNARAPIGNVQNFATALSVSNYFGATSTEAKAAGVYFGGFTNSNRKPGALLVAQYPVTSVAGYLRGGSTVYTLSQLQGLSGDFHVAVDGTTLNATGVNLSAATSYSSAAQIVGTALGLTNIPQASFTGAIAGTTLTVSAVASGTLAVGQNVAGAGVTAGTTITALGTATGGTGTYTVSATQTISSEAMTSTTNPMTYDSLSGAFVITSATTGATSSVGAATGTLATALMMTTATGAIISGGSAATDPVTFLNGILKATRNWSTVFTLWEPQKSDKINFASWNNTQINNYLYVQWDDDVTATQSGNTTSAGASIQAANYSGTASMYAPVNTYQAAAFVAGFVASIDFNQTDGRATLAFKGQTGFLPDVTDATIAQNLLANGYSFIGNYATANDAFTFCYDGGVSGPYQWLDSYINEIWLNNALQLAMLSLLVNVYSIPYNQAGYGLIRAALMDPIQAALNFGAIRAGVTLSEAQVAQVNNYLPAQSTTGQRISDVLQNRGWYLLIQDATAQVRQARASPPMTFLYMDGGSVQALSLASIMVQ